MCLLFRHNCSEKSHFHFHYALNDGGLMLGKSETITSGHLFELQIRNIDFIAEKIIQD
jgi:chemotaxis methyl-accepting protein methylase